MNTKNTSENREVFKNAASEMAKGLILIASTILGILLIIMY